MPAAAPRRSRASTGDSYQGITKPALLQLAHKAGVKSLSGLMYEELRGVMRIFVEDLVGKGLIYAGHAGRKTITPTDVGEALKLLGRRMYATDKDRSRCKAYEPAKGPDGTVLRKAKPGARAISAMRHAQKQAGCLHIPKAAFERVAREQGNVQWSAEAMTTAQEATEAYLVDLLADANLAAIHAKRTTVAPKDLQLVRKLKG